MPARILPKELICETFGKLARVGGSVVFVGTKLLCDNARMSEVYTPWDGRWSSYRRTALESAENPKYHYHTILCAARYSPNYRLSHGEQAIF